MDVLDGDAVMIDYVECLLSEGNDFDELSAYCNCKETLHPPSALVLPNHMLKIECSFVSSVGSVSYILICRTR